jgi:hypothetical protein
LVAQYPAKECVPPILGIGNLILFGFVFAIFKLGEAEDAMSKQLLTIEELTDKVFDRIRECKEGKGVSEISIYEIEDDGSNRNWGVTIVGPGRDDPGPASRAAISAMLELGRRYDLRTDERG